MKKPKVTWKYLGEELALFWVNPWSEQEEKIATFWWPGHPVEATKEAENLFEQIAARACDEDRATVSVHGSDGCSNCDEGRITIYAASRVCRKCEFVLNRAAQQVNVKEDKNGL